MIRNIPGIDEQYIFDNGLVYDASNKNDVHKLSADKNFLYQLTWNGNSVGLTLDEIICRTTYGLVKMCHPTKCGYQINSVTTKKDSFVVNGELFKISPRWNWLGSNIYGAVYDNHLISFRKQHPDRDGYYRFTPVSDCTNYGIHRFVYECWNKIVLPNTLTINHLDSRKYNNELSNLELASFAENTRYSILHQEKKLERVFTEDDTHLMCKMMQEGKTYSEISQYFGITDERQYHNFRNRLNLLRTQKTAWVDISSQYDLSAYTGNEDPNKKFSSEDIFRILQMRKDGSKINEIADAFSTSPKYISDIVGGRKRKREYDLFMKGSETIERVSKEKDLRE